MKEQVRKQNQRGNEGLFVTPEGRLIFWGDFLPPPFPVNLPVQKPITQLEVYSRIQQWYGGNDPELWRWSFVK